MRVQCAIVFSLVVRPDMQRYDESDSETDSESDSESDTEMTTVTVKTHSTTLRHAVERVPPRERKRHEALLEQSDVRECCLRSCTAQQSNHAYRCIVMATQPRLACTSRMRRRTRVSSSFWQYAVLLGGSPHERALAKPHGRGRAPRACDHR